MTVGVRRHVGIDQRQVAGIGRIDHPTGEHLVIHLHAGVHDEHPRAARVAPDVQRAVEGGVALVDPVEVPRRLAAVEEQIEFPLDAEADAATPQEGHVLDGVDQ